MFHFEKITQLAQVVFQDEGQISIRGQGVLKKVFLSAYLSENGQRILPPREHFYFNRDQRVAMDATLVRKVSTYFILSESEAKEQVELWENALVERARKVGVKFGEFGKFTFDGQLDFLAETLLYYQLLPEVAYKSVGAALHEYPVTHTRTATPAPVVEKSKRKILVPALWTLLVFLFGFAFYLWSGPLDAWIDQKSELNSRLVNVAPKSYTTDPVTEMYNDTDDLEETEGIQGSEEHETIWPNGGEDPVLQPSNDSENDGAKLASDAHPDDSRISSSAEDEIKSSPRCTLIVGAFADRGNVNRMVERLGSYGVEVVTMERKTLTLVGAAVSCSNADQMNTFRSEIDPNAWIYKK